MKKLMIIPLIIYPLIFNSCHENEVDEDLYHKVVGRWEIVWYRDTGYDGDELLHNYYFNSSDAVVSDDYEKALHFTDDGFINWENNLTGVIKGGEFATWGIENNSLKINYMYRSGTDTEIFKLTKTEFHFKITLEWMSDSRLQKMISEFELIR